MSPDARRDVRWLFRYASDTKFPPPPARFSSPSGYGWSLVPQTLFLGSPQRGLSNEPRCEPGDALVVPLHAKQRCYTLSCSFCVRFGFYSTSRVADLIYEILLTVCFVYYHFPASKCACCLGVHQPSSSPISTVPFVATRTLLHSACSLQRSKALNNTFPTSLYPS